MSGFNKASIPALLTIVLYLTSCATPVAPTGGEPDRSGPKLVSTSPDNATVNFDGRNISFTFAGYVNRSTFRNALSIEPGINVRYDVTWRRKTATIRLRDPLPDSTTVIFNIGTDLRDTGNNPISSPISLALSTGSEIDKGEVNIRVRGLLPTITTDNVSVLLYRDPYDLADAARYVGYPDTSGLVSFRYLSEGHYSAIVVNDVNRNRTWESNREFAQPLNVRSFDLKDDEPVDLGTIYYARRDTTRPELQGVGLLSMNRLRLRFSRPIEYKQNQSVIITRTSDNRQIEAIHLYNESPTDPVSFFHTTEALDADYSYTINTRDLADPNGNRVKPYNEEFEGSNEPDTTFIRYLNNLTENGIRPEEPLVLRYSAPITDPIILDSLKIYVNRSISETDVRVDTEQNLLKLYPQTRWIESNDYEIRAWNPGTNRYVNIQPRIIREADLGEVEITISDSTYAATPMRILLYNERRELYHNEIFTSQTTITGIRNGSYHLIVFHDVNNNGVWDFGSITPYRQPAAIYVDRRFPVRSRMTSTVEITF